MICPYCAEEIKEEAVVCKHCHRDFFAIRPLMDKIKELSVRNDELENQTAAVGAPQAQISNVDDAPIGVWLPTVSRPTAIICTFLLLVIAHFVIIVLFDLSLLYLRIVSIFVPIVFGFLYREHQQHYILIAFGIGLAIAVTTILAMSMVVARLDRVPVLPHDAAGWREFIEYTASIAFGFLTGALIRQSILIARSPTFLSNRLIRAITQLIQAKLNVGGRKPGKNDDAARLEAAISTAITIATALVSAVTGLRQFLS